VIAALGTGPVAFAFLGCTSFIAVLTASVFIASLLGRRDLDGLTDQKVGLDIAEWGDVNHGGGDLSDHRVDLANPLAAGQLHDLAEAWGLACKGGEHATFVADFADVCLKGHGVHQAEAAVAHV
jgi:hypothetical protein